MPPGGKNPLHIHPNCEEVLHLLEGTITHIVEDDQGQLINYEMETGDTCVVPRGKKHQAINTGTHDARFYSLYVFFSLFFVSQFLICNFSFRNFSYLFLRATSCNSSFVLASQIFRFSIALIYFF
jgi:hypothetical protein